MKHSFASDVLESNVTSCLHETRDQLMTIWQSYYCCLRGKWRLRALGLVSYQAGSHVTFRIHLMQSYATFNTLSFIMESC